MNTYIGKIDDTRIYEGLYRALESNELILFAGSGLSTQAKTDDGRHPPLWKGLLNGMIDWCLSKGLLNSEDAPNIQDLVEQGFLIEAGQELQENLEPSHLQWCLGEVILCNEAKASKAHRIIAQLPFRAYLTTNYDEFIEGEFRAQTGVTLLKYYERSIDGVLNAYRERKPFIYKLHGDITDPSSIVLGNRSYERLLYSNSIYRSCLESIFNMSSVLFIGFGGSDPDMEGIISRVAALDGRSKRHWMLAPNGSFPPLKAKRMWKDKGINVIGYDPDEKHSGVAQFLQNLASPPIVSLKGSRDSDKIKSLERIKRVEGIEE